MFFVRALFFFFERHLFFWVWVQVLQRRFFVLLSSIRGFPQAMEVAGVRSIHLHDGTVLLVFDDSMATSMRCWPLETLFRRSMVRVSVDTGCDSDTQVSVETDCEDWRRRYVDSVTDCMRQIEDLARKHHLPLSSFPVYGQLELMKGDLLWNAYTQPEDAASLLMQVHAALILWRDP